MSTSTGAPVGRPQSDVRKRTVLPTTLQNMRLQAATASGLDTDMMTKMTSDEYLDKIEEELNRKVDAETDVLVEGMSELVKMSIIQGKDHYRVAQEAFQAECRTESMIKATHALMSLSHTLKLLHLFSDTSTATSLDTRERLASELEKEIEALRKGVLGNRN